MEKSYILHARQFCPEACSFCSSLGHCHEQKEDSQITNSLQKAKSGEYKRIVLPCNLIFEPKEKLQQWISEIQSMAMTPVLQLNILSLNKHWLNFINELAAAKVHIQIVIGTGRVSVEKKTLVKELCNSLSSILFLLTKQFDFRNLEDLEWCKPLDKLYKVVMDAKKPKICFQSYELYRTLIHLKKYPEIRPYSDYEVFDSSVSKDLNFEPVIAPKYKNVNSNSSQLDYSVIIPTYNNQQYITPVLKHLFNQKSSTPTFEVIVVNDGSSDHTGQKIETYISNNLDKKITYIDFPRNIDRKMGDSQFRAGVARNLGVKEASGKTLIFLDADILVPNDFFEKINKEMSKDKLLLLNRHFLNDSASHENTDFYEIDIDRDVFVPEGGYWKSFFDSKEAWMEMSTPWKYVCTYGLIVSTKNFKEAGWFRKNYTSYGFEDTDLGYRLYKMGLTFEKSKIEVMHLNHSNSRSEYKNSEALRHMLLRRTANILFYNNLDPDIFESLSSLIDNRNLFSKLRYKFKRNSQTHPV